MNLFFSLIYLDELLEEIETLELKSEAGERCVVWDDNPERLPADDNPDRLPVDDEPERLPPDENPEKPAPDTDDGADNGTASDKPVCALYLIK